MFGQSTRDSGHIDERQVFLIIEKYPKVDSASGMVHRVHIATYCSAISCKLNGPPFSLLNWQYKINWQNVLLICLIIFSHYLTRTLATSSVPYSFFLFAFICPTSLPLPLAFSSDYSVLAPFIILQIVCCDAYTYIYCKIF